MTYDEFIQNILDTRGRTMDASEKERHHILPRCLGGSDDTENLIDLTYEEHFIAHKTLAEENPDSMPLQRSFRRLLNCKTENGVSCIKTPEDYKKAKLEVLKKASETKRNMVVSEETRRKISESKIGKKRPNFKKRELTDEEIALRTERYLETYWSKSEEERKEQTRKSIESRKRNGTQGKYWQGKTIPQETRNKISQTLKEKHLAPPHSLKVYCLETDTIYRSITEAQDMLGIDRHIIKRYIDGKRKDSNYHFKLVEEG